VKVHLKRTPGVRIIHFMEEISHYESGQNSCWAL
jgi:hypothetical protein